MNAFTYKNFQNDMRESVGNFIQSTDYEIKDISNSSITLSNGKKNITFYLESTSLSSEMNNVDGSNKYAIFELFLKEGVFEKYPTDKRNDYEYEAWNKFKVANILNTLKNDLSMYI